mgnify:CR=1 FL=1
MIKEIKYLIFSLIIIFFIFFTTKYYFSDTHKKKSFRSILSIDKKIKLFSEALPILENDTDNIIEFVKSTETIKKKKYYFWDLLNKDE